jgi:predicted transcriptional regulator of viral defense system
MVAAPHTQREQLRSMVAQHGIVRAQELRKAGIAGTSIQRALENGELVRIGRGLYQDSRSDIDPDQALAEVAKRIPKGVMTDQMPRKVWAAIGSSDWSPVPAYPPTRIIRFTEKYLRQGIEYHKISGVDVPIYSVAKTLADLFRNGRLVDRSVAVEGLRAAIEQRKATPGQIAEAARSGGAWRIMRPYLEALTFNG